MRRRWRVWARPVPADPHGPAGWAWFAAPADQGDDQAPVFTDGPCTPGRGDRTAIRLAAHTAATYDHERTNP